MSGRILPEDMDENSKQKTEGEKTKIKIWLSKALFYIFILFFSAGAGFGANYYLGFAKSGNGNSQQCPQCEKCSEEKFEISLNSDPKGASVYLDGSAASKFTPASVSDLKDGSHLLQLFYGARKWEASLNIEGGKLRNINALISEQNQQKENLGSIYLSSNPAGASIFINNKNFGKVTPVEISDLESGSYKITLSKEGYRGWSQEASVFKGSRMELLAILEENKQELPEDERINKGWRQYRNDFYGIAAEFPGGWSQMEAEKDRFDALFADFKDKIEYAGAGEIIIFSSISDYPLITVSVSTEDKARLIENMKNRLYEEIKEENLFNSDIFSSGNDRFAIIKKAGNPYTFIISFRDFGEKITEEIYSGFMSAFDAAAPQPF